MEEGWQEKVHNREEWNKLLRTARNRRILHMSMEWVDEGRKEGMRTCRCVKELQNNNMPVTSQTQQYVIIQLIGDKFRYGTNRGHVARMRKMRDT